jgi:hypothetical protein
MPASESFLGLRLLGGFRIVRLDFVEGPLIDAIGRAALAKTRIIGRDFDIVILSTLPEREKSVALYHEILEAVTVAATNVPPSVENFCEGDFERAAYRAQEIFGPVSPDKLNRMLQSYGFREE